MQLSDVLLKIGQKVRISHFDGPPLLRERLHEMGFHQGMDLEILGRAPFGGPLLIQFNTSFVALRMDEASCTHVERVESLNV